MQMKGSRNGPDHMVEVIDLDKDRASNSVRRYNLDSCKSTSSNMKNKWRGTYNIISIGSVGEYQRMEIDHF